MTLSPEYFRQLVESSREVMIYRMSLPEGEYEYVSPSAEEVFGHPPEDFYGNPKLIAEVIHPDWQEYFKREWERLISGEVPPSYEYQIVTRAGDVRWIHQRNSGVHDADDKLIAIQGIVTDITTQKQTEEVLARERVKEITCLYEVSRSLRECDCMESLFQDVASTLPSGWRYPEITRSRIRFDGEEYLGDDFQESEWCQASDIMVGGRPRGSVQVYYLEERPTLDGGPFSNQERDLLDGVARTLGSDLERRIAEKEVREGEARFTDLFTSNMVGILFWDWEGNITDANDAFLRMVGYTREEVLSGKARWVDMTPEEYRARDEIALAELATKGVCAPLEKEYICKDGSRVPIILVAALSEGFDDRGVAFILNITERERAEEKLVRSERDLRIRNRIAQIFLQVPDEQVYGDVLNVVLEATNSRYGTFGYLDEQSGALIVPSMTRGVWEECQVPEKEIVFPREQWGESIWVRALREGKTLYSNEPSTLTPPGHILITRNISVPLLHGDRAIGLFQVANKETDYSDQDIQVLEGVAEHVAPVLHARLQRDLHEERRAQAEQELREVNLALETRVEERTANLHVANEELKRAQAELSVQNEITQIFLTVSDEEMYNEALKVILDATSSKYGVLGYIDEAGAYVVPSMTRHIWDQCQVADKRFVFPREEWGESIWPRAIRQKKTLYSNELSTLTPEGHVPIQRNITVPIIHRGEVIGLFQVGNKPTDYDEWDLKTGKSIAEHLAPILSARLQRDRHEAERDRAQSELRRTAESLAATNRELEAFTYSVSHDLRGPLRAIDGFSRILLEERSDQLDDEGRRLLSVVRDNTGLMATLIEDLLEISRVGRRDLEPAPMNMESLVRTVLRELDLQDPDPGRQISVGSLPPAHGDATLLRQAWTNLLSNAFKFSASSDPAVIEVGGSVVQGENVYSVRDNGAGFNTEYTGKLFNMFERLHSKGEFEGTGVGLAIVKRIIDRHGGRVWGEGKVGEGATFWFTLPNAGKES